MSIFPSPKKRFATLLLSAVFVVGSSVSWAVSLSEISTVDANAGLKGALEAGSTAAIGKLGAPNGFLNNEKVKIRLPAKFDKVRSVLQLTGQGKKIDELEVSMNHAAEAAVPLAKPLFVAAIKSITLTDAKNILLGGDTAVTDFFRQKTATALSAKFLPLVKGVTDKAQLAKSFNSVMSKAQSLGVAMDQEPTVEAYVTKRATEGLFVMIAEEEKAIRKDPVGAGSKIVSLVFGALK